MSNKDVKVEECNFYNKIQSCERCELGSIKYQGKSSYKYHIDCGQNPNCYYKQLQLKEDENNRLRDSLEKIVDLLETGCTKSYECSNFMNWANQGMHSCNNDCI